MSRYLDKFRSTMPAVQGRQIIKLLTGMVNDGKIRTVDEYNSELQKLTQYLKSSLMQPFFKFFQAKVGDIITSDKYNAMVNAAKLDIEAAFKEIDTISTVLDFHKQLFKLTVLQALESAIVELNRTISIYEFLNTETDKWSTTQFNTFERIDDVPSNRLSLGSSDLFYDPRKKENTEASSDCQIDLYGKRLTLPLDQSGAVKIVKIDQIDNHQTTIPNRDLQTVTSNISNMIDGQMHTYWIYPLLVSSPITDGARIKLRLDLGGIRNVNFLQIESASPYPMILETVDYISYDNQLRQLDLNIKVDGNIGFDLGNISAQYITLVFKQETYETALYHRNPASNMWERIWTDTSPEEPDALRLDRIADELTQVITDDQLKTIVGVPDSVEYEQVNAYQYTFGFDNIRLFSNKYKTSGMFVGKKLTISEPGLIGLRTKEDNPDDKFSFEYYILKYNYDSSGALLAREFVPILPSTQGLTIENERLFLIKRSDTAIVADTATMRFTPNATAPNEPVVTRNLLETLTIGTEGVGDYAVRVKGGGWQTTWAAVQADINTYSGTVTPPVEVEIRFYEPNMHTIYTISYVASTRDNESSSTSKQRRLSDFIWMHDSCVLRCTATNVATSDIYLIAIMRNNSFDQAETASLLEYNLLISSYDDSKFME